MRHALTALVLVLGGLFFGCQPKTTLPQTDPKTWSRSGWQNFRWGMGAGDVELLLRVAQGDLAPLKRDRLPNLSPSSHNADITTTAFPDGGAINIVGMPCKPMFHFYKGELYRLSLSPEFPKYFGLKEQWAWRESVQKLLTEKYGKPSRSERKGIGNDESRDDAWAVDGSSVELDGFVAMAEETPNSGKFTKPDLWVTISYFDPDRNSRTLGLDPADKSKL